MLTVPRQYKYSGNRQHSGNKLYHEDSDRSSSSQDASRQQFSGQRSSVDHGALVGALVVWGAE